MSGTHSPAPSSASRKSSTSSAKPSPTSETSYAFLNFSHPSEAKDQAARRTVRSHVTRQQHQKEQLAAAAVRRTNSMPQTGEAAQQHRLEGRDHAASFPTMRPGLGLLVGQQSPGSRGSASSHETSVASSPLTPRVAVDPTQLYPAYWIPCIKAVFDHYVVRMSHDILDAKDQFMTDTLRTLWLPFVFTDAALLHATLLVAVSFYGSPPESRNHPIDILQLKGLTISAINESLNQEPASPVSDQTIAAVLSMAHYEAYWGEIQAFSFHMQALQRMVHMRGGLEGISTSLHGLLERMVRSVDFHTSQVTGAAVSFDPGQVQSSLARPATISQRVSAAPSRVPSR